MTLEILKLKIEKSELKFKNKMHTEALKFKENSDSFNKVSCLLNRMTETDVKKQNENIFNEYIIAKLALAEHDKLIVNRKIAREKQTLELTKVLAKEKFNSYDIFGMLQETLTKIQKLYMSEFNEPVKLRSKFNRHTPLKMNKPENKLICAITKQFYKCFGYTGHAMHNQTRHLMDFQ